MKMQPSLTEVLVRSFGMALTEHKCTVHLGRQWLPLWTFKWLYHVITMSTVRSQQSMSVTL